MTDQISDQLIYNEEKLVINEVEGSGFFTFTTKDFNLECGSATKARWEVYLMQYSLVEKQLILNNIWFKSKELDIKDLPKIKEKEPIKIARESEPAMGFFFSHAYKNLNLKCPFSGSISTFKETDAELYDLKFNFEDGLLVNTESTSLGAAEPKITYEPVEEEMLEELERLNKLKKGEQ
ncbi:MAG: hypothetical protein ACTSR8_09465 [Promethearchaeota archaeon]